MARKSKGFIFRPDYDDDDERRIDYKLMIHSYVRRDWNGAIGYLRKHNPYAAQRLVDALDLALRQI